MLTFLASSFASEVVIKPSNCHINFSSSSLPVVETSCADVVAAASCVPTSASAAVATVAVEALGLGPYKLCKK